VQAGMVAWPGQRHVWAAVNHTHMMSCGWTMYQGSVTPSDSCSFLRLW
jgi:hypothetical protein